MKYDFRITQILWKLLFCKPKKKTKKEIIYFLFKQEFYVLFGLYWDLFVYEFFFKQRYDQITKQKKGENN
jgi:hypothetical protein